MFSIQFQIKMYKSIKVMFNQKFFFFNIIIYLSIYLSGIIVYLFINLIFSYSFLIIFYHNNLI